MQKLLRPAPVGPPSTASASAAFLALSLAAGCSSATSPSESSPATSATPTSNADAGNDEKAARDAGATRTSSACSDLVQVAQKATLTLTTAAEPKPTGGALRDGTYVLEHVTRYALPLAEDDREFLEQVTLRIAGSTFDIAATQTIAGRSRERNTHGTFSVKGERLETTDECPKAATNRFEYSATRSELLLFGTFLGSRMVETFTRVE